MADQVTNLVLGFGGWVVFVWLFCLFAVFGVLLLCNLDRNSLFTSLR